jgi:hypothetical protein
VFQEDAEIRNMIIAWKDLQVNHPDFYHMLCNVFELMEIRKQIAVLKEGIVIEIRTKEQGHNMPHIHARYQGENISISLIDGTVLSGNIPKKNERIAVDYVLAHREKLLNEWNDIHGKTVLPDVFCKRPN